MSHQRRRVRDRIQIHGRPETKFSAEHWCEDLGLALAQYTAEGTRTWQLKRDRLRRLLCTLRQAIARLPTDTRAATRQLTTLELALASLNTGEVHPLLAPAPAGNRLPDSAAANQFRRVVLQCCVHLIASDVTPEDAYRIVARELTARGQGALKGAGKPFCSTTVKRWHLRVEPGETGTPENEADARWLDRFALNMLGTSKENALANVRYWLDDPRVRDIFPAVRKGGVLTH